MATWEGRQVVGRGAELAALHAGLRRAAEGHSHTQLVTGPTGVGKTALIRAAIEESGSEGLVLVGACLPLQLLSVPLLPLRSALRDGGTPGHEACLEAMEVVDHAPRALDAYLDVLTGTGPVVVFVDDLQWADRSTLDVLLYLAAGPGKRPLVLVLAARDEELPDGHPLHRWLADVERLARVSRLRLQPLGRPGTEEQVAALLGAVPHQGLVDDVFARTGGNPYLTSLLVPGLPSHTRSLPAGVPADLAAAVKRDWHELSGPARNVTSLVAVAGRPVAAGLLEAVAHDLGEGDVRPALEEAVHRRVLRLVEPDGYWFRHPLQAEVLEQGLGAPRRKAWHAAYARRLEADAAGAPVPLGTAVALSDHHHRAGDPAAAYAWALRAWEYAGPARGSPELRRLLRRAIELRAQVHDASEPSEELLDRLREAAATAGAFDDELVAVAGLLELVDEHERPLQASELHVRRRELLTITGAGTPSTEDARRAVDLAAAEPDSWQYAFALAELTRAEVWEADPAAGEHARRAVSIARDAGHPGALSYALTGCAMVEIQEEHLTTAASRTREALHLALHARDWIAFMHAAFWEANATTPPVNEGTGHLLQRRRRELTKADAPHVFVAMLSAAEAENRLLLGDWEASRDLLRVTLGSDLGAFVDVRSRVVAALLDAWQGRTTQAGMHLERAAELLTGPGNYASVATQTARAVVALAAGRPADAWQAALDGARAPGAPPHLCEWLVPLAARALADQAEADRDSGSAGAWDIDGLVEEFPTIVVDAGVDPDALPQLRAMQAWYDAEVARARQVGDLGHRWWTVAETTEAADLPWVAVYAWWRAAEAHLTRGRDQRQRGIEAWRHAGSLARRLGAAAIIDELGTLARIARVPSQPDTARAEAAAASLPGVTPREREILARLVAGSTYAEIAAALVISEKTVSSHVSNLLRKTGTANRVELARLVTRVGPDDATLRR